MVCYCFTRLPLQCLVFCSLRLDFWRQQLFQYNAKVLNGAKSLTGKIEDWKPRVDDMTFYQAGFHNSVFTFDKMLCSPLIPCLPNISLAVQPKSACLPIIIALFVFSMTTLFGKAKQISPYLKILTLHLESSFVPLFAKMIWKTRFPRPS